jgi:hypothetical protein
VQIIAYGLGSLAVGLAFTHSRARDRFICATLAVFWLWIGVVYHLRHFSVINPAAFGFGALFILQGVLLAWGAVKKAVVFAPQKTLAGACGALLVLYAMVVYPLLGSALGHGYPQAPMFGVTPCPTIIFTFGLLLWARPPVWAGIFVIPLMWSLIGFSAALLLNVREDFGLLTAGALTPLVLRSRHN